MAKNTLLINVDIGETRVALIEEGILSEFYVERSKQRSPVGNVYVGKVTRVLPGMQAAFVDIGLHRAAFLHVEDLVAEPGEAVAEDSESNGSKKSSRRRRHSRSTPIRDVLKEGQKLLVQVSKGPIGTKGARVTSHIALPGRYVVYGPSLTHVGVSKRIGNDKERQRLKAAIEDMSRGGIIVRTLAQGLTMTGLKNDIGFVVRLWDKVSKDVEKVRKAPKCVYEELDLVLRAARDLFTEQVDQIVIDCPEAHSRLMVFLETFQKDRMKDVHLYTGGESLYDAHGIEDELHRALARKVALPSGGHIVIDHSEALTAIDVNTGRFTGKGRQVEDTILQTNLEAVREIAYQLRFRNIGGLIVLDFIDMERSGNRNKVNKALIKALKQDKARTTTVRISELGLVEMTRKRTRESLGRTLYEPCFYCDGTGRLKSKNTVCHEIFRQMNREKDSLPGYKITIRAHPAVVDMLQRVEKEAV